MYLCGRKKGTLSGKNVRRLSELSLRILVVVAITTSVSITAAAAAVPAALDTVLFFSQPAPYERLASCPVWTPPPDFFPFAAEAAEVLIS